MKEAARRALVRPLWRFTKPWSQILKVKTTSISLSKYVLRDELVENEVSDPLVRHFSESRRCPRFSRFLPASMP